jgi:hypothetical protein
MVPIYSYLIDGDYGLDILVFSGDDDAVCATVGVQVGGDVLVHVLVHVVGRGGGGRSGNGGVVGVGVV